MLPVLKKTIKYGIFYYQYRCDIGDYYDVVISNFVYPNWPRILRCKQVDNEFVFCSIYDVDKNLNFLEYHSEAIRSAIREMVMENHECSEEDSYDNYIKTEQINHQGRYD